VIFTIRRPMGNNDVRVVCGAQSERGRTDGGGDGRLIVGLIPAAMQ